MVLWDKFLDFFSDHAAVVNQNEEALEQDVKLVRHNFGLWCRVKGFTDCRKLFLELHLAKEKKHPFFVAFIQANDKSIAEMVIKKSIPSVKTYKYKDTQNLSTILTALR